MQAKMLNHKMVAGVVRETTVQKVAATFTGLSSTELQQAESEMHEDDLEHFWESVDLQVLEKDDITDEELQVSRTEEYEWLQSFDALEYWRASEVDTLDKKDYKWCKNRFVDARKNGEARSRWVLMDFAHTKGNDECYSPTPEHLQVELMHVKALRDKEDIRYVDESRSFVHAPEEGFSTRLRGS